MILSKKSLRENFFPALIARKGIGSICLTVAEWLLLLVFTWWCLYRFGLASTEYVYIFAIPVTLLLLILFPIFLREDTIKHKIKDIKKLSGAESAKRIAEFYVDSFVWEQSETGNKVIVAYSSLHCFFETKHYFNLAEGNTSALYSIAKDGFTVGTADDFRTFMQEIVDENKQKE